MKETKKAENRIATNGEAQTPAPQDKRPQVVIKPLRMKTIEVEIKGRTPLMQLRFSEKAIEAIRGTQEAGSQAKGKKKREARNFQADYERSKHKFEDGSCGFPAAAIRKACISACRTVDFKMTLAKLSIFTEADGYDVMDGMPLIRIIGKPEMSVMPVRNSNGSCDLRARALWKEWGAKVRIRFDEDQFSMNDVVNLLHRAGQQVGIGEGRPDSKDSAGMEFGLFDVVLDGQNHARLG